jgi:hypothetical protein
VAVGQQSGAGTRFFLDLRVKGGELGLEGSAAGADTDVEFFAGPGTGAFKPVERNAFTALLHGTAAVITTDIARGPATPAQVERACRCRVIRASSPIRR